ncbi:hypothetical protein AAY473_023428 [Plecturocebus cupreus]
MKGNREAEYGGPLVFWPQVPPKYVDGDGDLGASFKCPEGKTGAADMQLWEEFQRSKERTAQIQSLIGTCTWGAGDLHSKRVNLPGQSRQEQQQAFPGTAREAEAGKLLGPRRQRLQRAEITPLHASLGNSALTLLHKLERSSTDQGSLQPRSPGLKQSSQFSLPSPK